FRTATRTDKRWRRHPDSSVRLRAACLALMLLLVSSTACFNSGVHPRTAELPRPGSWAMQVNSTIAAGAPGKVEFANGGFDTGNSAQREHPHGLGYIVLPYFNTTIGLGWVPLE